MSMVQLSTGSFAASKLVRHIRTTSAVYLSLACLSLTMPLVAAVAETETETKTETETETETETGIGEHRLFFTRTERDQTGGEQGRTDGAPEEEPGRGSVRMPVKSPTAASSSPASVKPQDYRIYYSALVIGRGGNHVLVNGLPCRTIDPPQASVATGLITLNCPGIDPTLYRLSLSMPEGRLQVSHAKHAIAMLAPGEGLP